MHESIIELKRSTITDTGQFTAYVSTFDNVDSQNDVIRKGAFTEALKRHINLNTKPALLWAHDLKEPIGRWTELYQDEIGLIAKGKLTLNTKRGAEAYALLQDKAISFSIAFAVSESGSITKNGIRYINSIAAIPEISLVAIPANTNVNLIDLKQVAINKRRFERVLQTNGGLSRKQAMRLTAGEFGGLIPHDKKFNQFINAIQCLTAAINSTR